MGDSPQKLEITAQPTGSLTHWTVSFPSGAVDVSLLSPLASLRFSRGLLGVTPATVIDCIFLGGAGSLVVWIGFKAFLGLFGVTEQASPRDEMLRSGKKWLHHTLE